MSDESQGQPANTRTDQSSSAEGKPTETQVEGTKPEAGAEGGEAGEIKYEFKAPEGVELDETLIAQFTEQAKELKLPADKAQALVEMGAEAVRAQMNRLVEADKARRAEWAAQVEKDPEVGGPKLKENLAAAGAALAELAPDLKGFLDETGLGNHPAMVRLAVKLSKLTKQDGYIVGGLPSPGNGKGPAPKDYAARLYPNLKQG